MFSRVQPPLILASTSPYRRELLARLRVPFETLPPGVAEDALGGESHADRALGVHAGVRLAHVDTTTVFVRRLTVAEIERYVASEQPFDCAGGFKAEGAGIALFERIESQDPTALIGLPLIWLAQALRAAGLPVP